MRRTGEGLVQAAARGGTRQPADRARAGVRTGRTMYGADDDDDDGTKRGAKTVENGRGDGAVRRRVEAFRRGLGLLVIALADATRDSEDAERAQGAGERQGDERREGFGERRATSTTPKSGRPPLVEGSTPRPCAFLARRGGRQRRRNGIAPPLIREETVAVARSKRGGRGGGRKGRAACRCHSLERLDVDAFVAHLTTGPDSRLRRLRRPRRYRRPAARHRHELQAGSPPQRNSPAIRRHGDRPDHPHQRRGPRAPAASRTSTMESAALRDGVAATGTASGR